MSRAWPVAGIDPDAALAENARRILAVRIAEFYSWAPAIPHPAAIEPLHNLRISAKRLRYTLELFRAVFGEAGERQIERVKALQEDLGTIHDHDVRIDLVEDELRSLAVKGVHATGLAFAAADEREHAAIAASALRPPPDDPRRGLLAYLGRQHAARRDHHLRFVERWNRLDAEGFRRDLVLLSLGTPLVAGEGAQPKEREA